MQIQLWEPVGIDPATDEIVLRHKARGWEARVRRATWDLHLAQEEQLRAVPAERAA